MVVKSSGSYHQSDEHTRLLSTSSNGKLQYSSPGELEEALPHEAAEERLSGRKTRLASTGGLRRGLSSRQVQMIAIGESFSNVAPF